MNKIKRYQAANNFIWYEYNDLHAYSIRELILQMYTIYGVDYRQYLFDPISYN